MTFIGPTTPSAESASLTLDNIFADLVSRSGAPSECPAHRNAINAMLRRRGHQVFVFSDCGCRWYTENSRLIQEDVTDD